MSYFAPTRVEKSVVDLVIRNKDWTNALAVATGLLIVVLLISLPWYGVLLAGCVIYIERTFLSLAISWAFRSESAPPVSH